MSENGSVQSIETICSDGCPVSPSALYDQRALVYETRKYQSYRKSITSYRYRKIHTLLGKSSSTVWHLHGTNAKPLIEHIEQIEQIEPLHQRRAKTEHRQDHRQNHRQDRRHPIQPYFHNPKQLVLEPISICL